MNVDYHFKQGDTRPVIEEELDIPPEEDLTETGVSVAFTLTPAEGRATPIVDAASATIVDGRRVSYTLDSADTQSTGEYFASFEVTYPDGGVETFPKGRFLFLHITGEL